MKNCSIGEVCNLLGVKQHMIRYWEREFPLLKPKRSLAGRRLYGEREIQLLFRFAFLLRKKHCSLKEAKQVIWREIGSEKAERQFAIQEIRGNLLGLFKRIKAVKKNDYRKPGADN